MTIRIGSHEFKTQKALHAYIDRIRTLSDDAEFEREANGSENSALLAAILDGRPSKRVELAGRKVVHWSRVKRGGRWSFDAILDDGSTLDMGVNNDNISEFVRNRALD